MFIPDSRVSYINLILLFRFYFLSTDHGTDFDAYEVVYQTWGHMILQYLLPLGVMIILNLLMLRTVSKNSHYLTSKYHTIYIRGFTKFDFKVL